MGLRIVPLALMFAIQITAQNHWTLIGWNNLGMHCLDGDYSVFSVLPPYNTIHAQLMDPSGRLVRDAAGISVTYAAVRDSGSINTTARGKTNFWRYVQGLFGAAPAPDMGLAGSGMPGPDNQEQPMKFDAARRWFTAEGIPITSYDDAGDKNYYPMMRVTARDAAGNILAATDIVLPVSDEMDCRACHGSGSGAAARPAAGWVWDAHAERDYKRNILRLHDEKHGGSSRFAAAMAAAGYPGGGLFPSAEAGKPVLCAACHGSNALPGTGQAGIAPLTQALHGGHAGATDPTSGATLDDATNRAACYRCHPGSETRCLRGAMGKATGADGSAAIQCQSCHGGMSMVGAAGREGWLDEPGCQSCHPGGGVRFTSALEDGHPRAAVTSPFSTNPDTPAAGHSLYRFSTGHGGLQCEACHGSTHAEFPSSHNGDNAQSVRLQGHAGTLDECTTCHGTMPSTATGGPHGMHTAGQNWVRQHEEAAERGRAACAVCHGSDFRGTPLSRTFADRTLSAEDYGTKQLWRGSQVGCYLCHSGPDSERRNANRAPAVNDARASAASGAETAIPLSVSDADGNPVTLRVVTPPEGGSVRFSGTQAFYRPRADFEGEDSFTYAAWDGASDSNLGTVRVTTSAPGRAVVSAGGVANAASYEAGSVSPGGLVSIFGIGMGPAGGAGLQLNSAGFVSRALSGTRVLFDGMAAPITYASESQVNVVAPYRIAGRDTVRVQVERMGIQSAATAVRVVGAAPGIFTMDASGRGQGAILNQDGSVNSASQPAPRGSVISVYATGEGQIDASVFDGQVSGAPAPQPLLPVEVRIGGVNAPVLYAGAAPGLVAGVLQVNARVPDGIAAGAVPVVIVVGGTGSQDGVTVAVK